MKVAVCVDTQVATFVSAVLADVRTMTSNVGRMQRVRGGVVTLLAAPDGVWGRPTGKRRAQWKTERGGR